MSDQDKKRPRQGLASTMAIMDNTSAEPVLPFASGSSDWLPDTDTLRFKLTDIDALEAIPCMLLWSAPNTAPHLRRHKPFKRIIDKLADAPPDPELDDPALAEDPQQSEERREIFEVLANASPTLLNELNQALSGALRPDGKMVPPLVLLSGALKFEYNSKDALQITVHCAQPVAAQLKALEAPLMHAQQLLAADGPALATGMYAAARSAILKALASGGHPSIATSVDQHTRDALLQQRLYQRYEVLGAEHLRATLSDDDDQSVSLYLPAEAASLLPLKHQFRARVIGHVHIDIDASEGLAIATSALARILSDWTS